MSWFILKPVPPFRLDLTVWVLRRVPINAMDRWDGQTYRRVLLLDGAPVEVAVVQTGPPQRPELTITTRGRRLGDKNRMQLIAMLQTTLGLNVDLAPLYQIAVHDRRLSSLIAPFAGFRPPRLPSVFETLLNGIACQQISLVAGMHLLNRLCRRYGPAVGDHHAFPSPADLADATTPQIRSLGFSTRKAQTILDIRRAIVSGELDLDGLAQMDDAAALERLLELKGIGRWTAQYALLRGLGRLDVFPADDVGSQSKMQRWLKRPSQPDYEGMYRILAPWRPYRGIIYFFLLLNHQSRLGLLGAGPASGKPPA